MTTRGGSRTAATSKLEHFVIIKIEGYNLIRADHLSNTKQGGVLFITNTPLLSDY